MSSTELQPVRGRLDPLVWRVRRLMDGSTWPLRVRLDQVNPMTDWRSNDDYLRLCRSLDSRQEPYFGIAGKRIYYRAEDLPVADETRHLDATLTILREAYLFNEQFDDPRIAPTPGEVVFDLGGNIGTSALHLADRLRPGGRVFSFEPITHAILSHNVEANGAGDVVQVVPMAVADREGELPFDTNDSYIDSSLSRVMRDPDNAARVPMIAPVTTVDTFVDSRGIDRLDLIKMDIEGAEELALRGARETVRRFRPRWTISSYHRDHMDEPQHDKLVALLREMGYETREVERRHIFAW
jgi:FkbM family methyltransferase